MTTTHKIPLSDVPHAIRNGFAFQAHGAMRADTRVDGRGRLPDEYCDSLYNAESEPGFYVVYSYDTPIAWAANGEWTVPPVKYSPTTTKHQNIAKKGMTLW